MFSTEAACIATRRLALSYRCNMHTMDSSRSRLVLAICFAVISATTASAQVAGETPVTDSVVVFTSPRPLIEASMNRPKTSAAGIDLLFSGSGWGLGGFWQTLVADNLTIITHLGISGKRNTDEFENVLLGPTPVVWEKVNRLFMFPATVGLQYRLFNESLQESFRPFVSGGIGPTLILATPYLRDDPYQGVRYYEFFSSFADATTYVRAGGYVGVGAHFGSPILSNLIGVNIRYFHIPFGGEGIESVRGRPVTNFGGIILSLTVGSAY